MRFFASAIIATLSLASAIPAMAAPTVIASKVSAVPDKTSAFVTVAPMASPSDILISGTVRYGTMLERQGRLPSKTITLSSRIFNSKTGPKMTILLHEKNDNSAAMVGKVAIPQEGDDQDFRSVVSLSGHSKVSVAIGTYLVKVSNIR